MNYDRAYGYIFKFLNEHKRILGILSLILIASIAISAIKIGQSIGKFIYSLQAF